MGFFDLFRKKQVEKVEIEKTEGKTKKQPTIEEQMHAFAKEYIEENKNTKYDFFGYVVDPDEIPFFVEATTKRNSGEFEFSNSVTPVTPSMLRHCVTNMTTETMKQEAKNMNSFVKKCHQIASAYAKPKIPMESWNKVIAELMDYIQRPHHLSNEELKLLTESLSVKDLASIDWNDFGSYLKTKEGLPHSYDKTPTEVEVSLGKDNVPRVLLRFASKTTPNYRELRIRKGNVFKSVNGETSVVDKKLSKIWKDYCGITFESCIQEEKQIQK